MSRDPQKMVSNVSNQFDDYANTCAEPQAVLKSGSTGDNSSESDLLGAFVLAVTEILFKLETEGGEDNGNDSSV